MDTEQIQALWEQEKVKETLSTEGAKVIVAKMQQVAKATYQKEQKADPFKEPGEIVKPSHLRNVIETLLPQILEGVVNYDPEAIDKKIAPKERWTFKGWVNKILGRS